MSSRKRPHPVDLELRDERNRLLHTVMERIEILLERLPLPAVVRIVEGVYGKHLTRSALVRLGLGQMD